MDVILQTNSDDPALALGDITRFSDGSGYIAQLQVRSRGFLLDRPFYFDGAGLAAFVVALRAMDLELMGTAELRTPYEDHFIHMAVSRRGKVVVSGEVREYSERSQLLQFAFETDQTVLAPLARDLEASQHLAAI